MEGIDEISKLPEPILHHILSFLVVKDAAKMSTLSKALYNAWTSLPCLDFGDATFRVSINIVDQILANRQKKKISVQRFRLKLPYHCSIAKYVDNMIKLLVACNVKELFLEIESAEKGCHKLPEAIFAAKTLEVLRLRGYRFKLPSNSINFSSLRELCLVYSFVDEQLLQSIGAICSDLEVLSLRAFEGLTSLEVAGTLPKLKTVKLESCHSQFRTVDIVAPNLEELHISSLHVQVIKITSCKSLKHLKLGSVPVTDQWLENLFPNLPNLEILRILLCNSLRSMKISSVSLKHLTVHMCYNLIVVDLDTPNLLKFSSDVRYGRQEFSCPSPCDVETLTRFKVEAPHLLQVYLDLIPQTRDTDGCPLALGYDWYPKLIESLGNFSHSKGIELSCIWDKAIVIPVDEREDLVTPLYGANHLRVIIQNELKYSVVDLLDSLLWISPQLETLETLSLYQPQSFKTLKFTYRDAADGDEKPCCASLPWKCWKHELKKVRLKGFTCMVLQDVRDYFLRNTDMLEIIEEPPECSL